MANIPEKTHILKNGSAVTIRTVHESDADAYLDLAKSIMAEQIYSLTQPEELHLTVDQESEWLKVNIENECHLVICAEIDRQLVGQLDFSNGHRQRNAHTGEFGMGVHKDFRGLGIGSLLVRALIEWAKNNPKIEKINLCVHHTNDRAIATYKKNGFAIEGKRIKDLKYPGGVFVDTILMGLHVMQN